MPLPHPPFLARLLRAACATAALLLCTWAPSAQADGVLGPSPETMSPLVTQGSPPLVLLTMARDHTLFFGAYNDLTALSGEGAGKVGFQPTTNYLGLFNSNYCYGYAGGAADADGFLTATTDGLFSPAASAVSAGSVARPIYGQCADSGQSSYWSGNFLNYLTTARIDALRVALYGGTREVDTATDTILRRAYIPRDAHAWAIEYKSTAENGYDIALFTPLSQPSNGTRHLMGNLTDWYRDHVAGHSCINLDYCSSFPPLLRVVSNSTWTLYEWILVNKFVMWTRRPYEIDRNQPPVGTYKDYAVRVKVCTSTYNDGCTAYTSSGTTSYKPTGVLHQYGATGEMKFGLLTGSYDNNQSGGRIRKNVSAFTDEVNNSNGRFLYPNPSIIGQIDKLRITGYYAVNDDDARNSFWDYTYRGYGENNSFSDWGSPMAEMMFEGLRYFAGASRTAAFNPATATVDALVGLQAPTWADPYSNTGNNVCAKPSQLVVGGVTTQYDSDQLPGSYFNSGFGSALSNERGDSLNVTDLATGIGGTEGINDTIRVVGEAPASLPGTPDQINGTPTPKTVGSLGKVRGQPVDETMRAGSYYAASVAYFGKKASLRSINGTQIPTLDTYALAINSPFPKIVVPFGADKTVTVYPFAKYAHSPNIGISNKANRANDAEQNGVFIQTLTDPTNAGGNYHLNMIVRYGQTLTAEGYGLHSTVEYDIRASGDQLAVTAKVLYAQINGLLNIGYSITGTTQDGPYLVVQTKNEPVPYYLNVPPGRLPGYCDKEDMNTAPDDCKILPYYQNADGNGLNQNNQGSQFTFTASTTQVQPVLNPPLWYAAKWGGYPDGIPPTGATQQDPDNYYLLKNAQDIKNAFGRMLQRVLDQSQTASGRSGAGKQLSTQAQVFTTRYNNTGFSGELTATTVAPKTVGAVGGVDYLNAWTAAVPDEPNRAVYYRAPSGSLNSFNYSNLNSDYPGNLSSDLVGYLRGNQSNEKRSGGNFRDRSSLLGTTINSAPVYSPETGMVYLGANDGMLHAFSASTGVEQFAFVPSALISSTTTVDDVANRSILAKLSSPSFSGRYFMDGNMAVSSQSKADPGMNGANYLVGFLGRGGKGLFGLPLNSQGLKTDGVAWENFGDVDNDMGYLLGTPVVEQLTDGTNVVLFGNGYNSASNQAALYVVRLRDGVVLGKYATNTGTANTPNGLATPGVTRQAGYVQYAYAGDYRGNVWKFDLTGLSGTASSTLVETFGNGNSSNSKITKLFTATDGSGTSQPIVAPMVTAYSNNSGDPVVQNKRFVFFGTGSDLNNGDLAKTQTQTMYGLVDPGTTGQTPVIAGRANLQVRTLDTATGTFNNYSNTPVTVRSFSLPAASDMAGDSGWYMDWSTPAVGPSEKVYSAANLRRGATPALVVSSNIVNATGCATSSAGYLNAMDAYHGGALTDSFFDLNRNGSTQDEKFTVGNTPKSISSVDFGVGAIGQAIFSGDNIVVQGASGRAEKQNLVDTGTKKSSQVSRRISWREVVR